VDILLKMIPDYPLLQSGFAQRCNMPL